MSRPAARRLRLDALHPASSDPRRRGRGCCRPGGIALDHRAAPWHRPVTGATV